MLYMWVFPKGLFTLSVIVDSYIDASTDTWKEYIGFDCIIHTNYQYQHQHQCQNSNGSSNDSKASTLASPMTVGVNMA